MTPAELQADAQLAGEILSAIWASLPKQQQQAIEAFAVRTGKQVAAVAVHALLTYGAKRIAEGGPLDLDALYASPAFAMPVLQGAPPDSIGEGP